MPFQYFNFCLYILDQWVQYFDQTIAVNTPSSTSELNARLINGGTWSFSAASGALVWTNAFNLAFPGTADANNQVAAGSLTLSDGAVMYVTANVPFTTTGNTTSGSTQLTSLAYQLGIQVGQTVTGSGLPVGVTVVGVSGTTVTLSAAATGSFNGATYTFESSGALTPVATAEGSLVSAINTVVIARRVGSIVIVGVGSGQMVLRDAEQKMLLDTGYLSVMTAPAGQALTAGQPVYISQGATDGGRTAGALYPVDASAGLGPTRCILAGIVVAGVSTGAGCLVVTDGNVNGYSGLTVGAVYYVNPATPGAITATKPTVAGQWVISAGLATSTSALDMTPAGAALPSPVASIFSPDGYGVSSEAQLVTALAACNSTGGGIIALIGAFSVNAAYTVPANTIIEGGLNATLLTLANAAAGFTLLSGSQLSNVWMTCPLNSSTLATLSGNNTILRQCRFALTATSGSPSTCVYVTGSGNRIYNTTFINVTGGTGIGINYASGTNNLDDSSIFQ